MAVKIMRDGFPDPRVSPSSPNLLFLQPAPDRGLLGYLIPTQGQGL